MLIDGNHNFEFALFDLQMAAKLLRPNGIVVMDNAEQSGPFHASRHFLRSNTEWREIGTAISGHDPTAPFNVERSSVSGTSFLLLQGPSFVPLYKGTPQSWGQQYVDSVQMSGFAVDLVPQDAQGTLYYQAVLRAFADNNKSVEEHRSLGSVPIKASGEIRKVQHRFPKTLRTNLPIRFTECRQSVEIEVVWEPAGNLNAPLKLKTAPTPIF